MNLIVRAKNKVFWIAFIPAVLMLIQSVLKLFGVEWEPEALQEDLIEIVGCVFALLAIMGIVVDPTTDGLTDSDRAMTYTCPVADMQTEEDEPEQARQEEEETQRELEAATHQARQRERAGATDTKENDEEEEEEPEPAGSEVK